MRLKELQEKVCWMLNTQRLIFIFLTALQEAHDHKGLEPEG